MRIITGSARGARLKAPKGMQTRPTSDRIKESLFSILGDFVRGKRVLDLFRGDVFSVLPRLESAGRQFQLIFCDPPYHAGLWERALSAVDRSELLAPDGLLILEHGGDEALPEGGLHQLVCVREVRYGPTSAVHIFQRKAEGGACHEEGRMLREF